MEFDPRNNVIALCVQGMGMEDKGKPEAASRLFLQAWDEATNDFEKFTAAYYVARHQETVRDKLHWLETSLRFALKINDATVKAAFPALYSSIAKCYEESNDLHNAKTNYELADSFKGDPSDNGPFYHGTKSDMQIGDLLTAGRDSNYQTELTMNHIYFTALANGAGLAAALAKGDGRERVYIVEPTGSFENEPERYRQEIPRQPHTLVPQRGAFENSWRVNRLVETNA